MKNPSQPNNKYHQGLYVPKHPEKYVGRVDSIRYRSGWERKVMLWLDLGPEIKRWASEPFPIPYISPLDGRGHRYYFDFWLEKLNGTKYIIEVKPYKQTIMPVLKESTRSAKKIEQYNYSAKNFIINTAKWKAAQEFCNRNEAKFLIITEKDLKLTD